MKKFPCPYLKGDVELTDEREADIAEIHPDLLPEYLPQLGQTLEDPDEVRRSARMSGARMFYRWFDDVRLAERGKGSMGWFYGFKLHLVINAGGELLACQITPANVDDRKPVPWLCKGLFGKLIADRGYVSQSLFEQLLETFEVQLITTLRKNLKNRLLPLMDKLLLRKRAIVEIVVAVRSTVSSISSLA